MRTVDYSEILNGSAALSGMGPSEIGLAEQTLFRQFHDRRLQKAWEIHNWPELCRIEQRTFRALWLITTTYAATAEVYDQPTSTYYQSLQAGNLGNAPTIAGVENSAFWAQSKTAYVAPLWASGQVFTVGQQAQNPGDLNFYQCTVAHTSGVSFDLIKFGILTPFNRYIDYDQVNADGSMQTPVGDFFRATDVNPEITTKVVEFPFFLSWRGAQFVQLKHQVAFVWIDFRIRRPVLVGDAWDASLAYNTGQQVYYVGTGVSINAGVGNMFNALGVTAAGDSPETAAGSWSKVEIPYIFRGYLITGGYVDWLTGDGQGNKAANYEIIALEALELEADKLQRQSGQVRRLSWSS